MGWLLRIFPGKIWLYLFIGGIVLSAAGFVYWQYTSIVSERAILLHQVQTLNDVVEAKEQVIILQRELNLVASDLSTKNAESIEKAIEDNRVIQEQLETRTDADEPASDYLREYFSILNGTTK